MKNSFYTIFTFLFIAVSCSLYAQKPQILSGNQTENLCFFPTTTNDTSVLFSNYPKLKEDPKSKENTSAQQLVINNYAVNTLKKLGYQSFEVYACVENEKNQKDICRFNYVSGYCSTPEFLDSKVNSKYNESSVCVSNDGQTLYFSSNKNGGYGGYDIYCCEIKDDGSWSLPVNLGNQINTKSDEVYPQLLDDGVSLVFKSNRDKGMDYTQAYFSTFIETEGWTLASLFDKHEINTDNSCKNDFSGNCYNYIIIINQ